MADDASGIMLWSECFLQEQGHNFKLVSHQDSKSAKSLLENGEASSSKRTRHVNIRHYFLNDKIETGESSTVCCNTDDMIADFFTKPHKARSF